MKVVSAGVIAMTESTGDELWLIEKVGRTCYKSENHITDESSVNFVKNLIKRKHYAMLEHMSFTLKFICDRGVSHEIVRHRLASFAQESTRYCNYSKDKFGNEITVIKPCFWDENSHEYKTWYSACKNAEDAYFNLIDKGATPQEARSVLPNSLKTEIIVTMNYREWIHFFNLRACDTTGPAHPQMSEVARKALAIMHNRIPIVFDEQYNMMKELEK